MKIGSVLVIVFLIAVAVIFIYVTVKVNSLEQKSRDKSSEIDGSLWDRAFQLSKIVELLNNKGIEHTIEMLDVNTFGLGMSATLQATYSEKIDVQDVALRELMKEHKELLNDPEFMNHVEKFNAARNELFRASVAYNKATNERMGKPLVYIGKRACRLVTCEALLLYANTKTHQCEMYCGVSSP